jgi:3-phenylpropionate/trans-cinnamate dioxygenase ferredoxin subunit
MTWHPVMAESALDPDFPSASTVAGKQILLVRLGEKLYCTSNVCTHAQALLSDGYQEDDCIECPLHGARYHIPTGKLTSGPECADLATYEVQIKDGQVLVQLPD